MTTLITSDDTVLTPTIQGRIPRPPRLDGLTVTPREVWVPARGKMCSVVDQPALPAPDATPTFAVNADRYIARLDGVGQSLTVPRGGRETFSLAIIAKFSALDTDTTDIFVSGAMTLRTRPDRRVYIAYPGAAEKTSDVQPIGLFNQWHVWMLTVFRDTSGYRVNATSDTGVTFATDGVAAAPSLNMLIGRGSSSFSPVDLAGVLIWDAPVAAANRVPVLGQVRAAFGLPAL